MESLNFAVGLRAVGTCPLRGDSQFGAGFTPRVGNVGRPVVGQHPLDSDPAFGEPGHRALQQTDCRDRFFVGANLGVSDPGVIVNDSVHERRSSPGAPILGVVASIPGAAGHQYRVVLTLLSAHELVTTAVGDVAELGDIDVNQRAGMGMLVAAQRRSGAAAHR